MQEVGIGVLVALTHVCFPGQFMQPFQQDEVEQVLKQSLGPQEQDGVFCTQTPLIHS